jgi:hypothetical protein
LAENLVNDHLGGDKKESDFIRKNANDPDNVFAALACNGISLASDPEYRSLAFKKSVTKIDYITFESEFDKSIQLPGDQTSFCLCQGETKKKK